MRRPLVTLYVDCPPDEALRRLAKISGVDVDASRGSFSVSGSTYPIAQGSVAAAGQGTIVRSRIDYRSTLVHCVLCVCVGMALIPVILVAQTNALVKFDDLSLGVAVAVGAFGSFLAMLMTPSSFLGLRGRVRWQTSELRKLGTEIHNPDQISELQRLTDASVPGAESGAPWSLRPVLGDEAVEFQLDAKAWGRISTTTLRVDRYGLRVGDLALGWDDVRRVEVTPAGLDLHLGDTSLSVPANAVPGRDLGWLRDYLQSRDRRFGADENELAEARSRLQALHGLRASTERPD